MNDLAEALRQNRAAVAELLAAAEGAHAEWAQPPAPGKWSPAQLVEHVARALEQSGRVIAGQPSDFPTFPRLVRPVLRGIFFNKVLKRGRFPGGARTNTALDPATGPATPAEARVRLEAALGTLEQAARSRGAGEQRANSTIFGWVPLPDYVMFQAIHTRHHCRRLPAAPR